MTNSRIQFVNIPTEILELPLTWTEKGILGVVHGFTLAEKDCWVTDIQFGDAFGIHPVTINKTISKLIKAGILERSLIRTDSGTPRRLALSDSYKQIAYRVLANRLEGISESLRASKRITKQIEKKEKEIKVIETDLNNPCIQKAKTPSRPKKQKQALCLDELDLPGEIKEAAERWFRHKQIIGKPIKMPKLISDVKKYGVSFPAVVQKSIDQGWDGLFALKPQKEIAPWLRASQLTSDLIAAFQQVDFQNPKTSEGYQAILRNSLSLKDIITVMREKERIPTPSAFINRIQVDEFFRIRIEKSIKEQLTVILTSGQKENI